jgi:hypothetical protein
MYATANAIAKTETHEELATRASNLEWFAPKVVLVLEVGMSDYIAAILPIIFFSLFRWNPLLSFADDDFLVGPQLERPGSTRPHQGPVAKEI